jgi:hypothetical protein
MSAASCRDPRSFAYLSRRSIALAWFATVLMSGTAQAQPVVEFGGGGAVDSGANLSIGWGFTTNQAINVVNLDAFAVNAAGSQVRIYDSTGTTLASTTVLPTDPTEGTVTPVYYHAIAPLALSSGQTYYIAEDYVSNDPQFGYNETLYFVDPSITFGPAVAAFGTGVNPMTNFGGPNNGYFGPDFDIGPVPEPSSLVLCGAVSGLAVLRRRSAGQKTGQQL